MTKFIAKKDGLTTRNILVDTDAHKKLLRQTSRGHADSKGEKNWLLDDLTYTLKKSTTKRGR
jgi:hypothetical protein